MEKRKNCSICNKTYANGKALGGHMRTHFIMFPLPPKPPLPPPPPPPRINSPESKLVAATTRRRSQRPRRLTPIFAAAAAEAEKLKRRSSSSSNAASLSDEEAAKSLMYLSRDTWPTERAPPEEEEEEMADSSALMMISCETCGKEFGSYQALGGHKANHKRMKSHCKRSALADNDNNISDEADGDIVLALPAAEEQKEAKEKEEKEEEEEEEEERVFQCEYCFKVFGSGKALGGHKKAHYSTHLPKNALNPNFGGTLVIDLTFASPPPSPTHHDDNDDDEVEVHFIG